MCVCVCVIIRLHEDVYIEFLPGDVFGEPKHSPCTVRWLRKLILEDKMVDTFSSSHPYAQCRYTCWNQQDNSRYSNDGARLDHILIDEGLHYIEGGDLVGYTSETGERREEKRSYEENENLIEVGNYDIEYNAALRACTANFLFQQAPTDGGGIPEAVTQAYEHQFTSSSGCNIVYTPPEYSDHVAVQCVLSDDGLDHNFITSKLVLGKDTETKFCQPHIKQKMLTSYFSISTSSTSQLKSDFKALNATLPSSAALSTAKIIHVDGNYNGSSICNSGGDDSKVDKSKIKRKLKDSSLLTGEKRGSFFDAKKKS